jgi:hypothetical protein
MPRSSALQCNETARSIVRLLEAPFIKGRVEMCAADTGPVELFFLMSMWVNKMDAIWLS